MSRMELSEHEKDVVDRNCITKYGNEAIVGEQEQGPRTCVINLNRDDKVIAPEEAIASPCLELFVLQTNNNGGQGGKELESSHTDQNVGLPLEPESLLGTGGSAVCCVRTISAESQPDCCRICQQNNEEPLLELGCQCRGELSRAHRFCIEQWFTNKGSNKCEICQSVATNISAPPTQPMQKFWIWRIPRNEQSSNLVRRNQERARFHPLWVALLILIVGLLFDVLISVFLGASALPVNIIIGVLVVLGIGTAARLIVECWHERELRRNVARLEMNVRMDQRPGRSSLENSHGGSITIQVGC